ncbi:Crp/Fnr family transcriptional regulator [Rubellimicrobium roseum]|nr:Crp/Fnr family transcriptional regulator [Rubellimicrobium roseum]
MRGTTSHAGQGIDPFVPAGGYLSLLLETFSAESRARLDGMARVRTVPAKTVLVREGERPNEIGFVLSGILALTRFLPSGRAQISGLLAPTDMYGRIFSGRSRHHVESLSEARLICFDRAHFEALVAKDAEVERVLLTHVLDELDIAREWVLLLNGSKVIERVASFLILLMSRHGGGLPDARAPMTLQVPLSREDLASYLGTRPETLSRAFHELADKGIIHITDPYRFDVVNLPALIKVSGRDFAPDGGD